MIAKRAAQYTRTDIAQILAGIGEPGKKRAEKLQAVRDLRITNFQGVGLEATLQSFKEY